MELLLTRDTAIINGRKILLSFLNTDWAIPKEEGLNFKKEDWVLSDNTKLVKYVMGSTNNYIEFSNGSIEPLSDFDENYNKYFYKTSELVHLASLYKQHTLYRKPVYTITMMDIYKATLDKREAVISSFKAERNCTDEFLVNKAALFLDKYKKKNLEWTDWTQLPDVQASFTQEEKDAWIQYRAKLRVLDEEGPVLEVILPKEP